MTNGREPASLNRGMTFYDGAGTSRFFSYAQLERLAGKAAEALEARGWKPGDRLGLIAETSPEFVVMFLACQRAGLIPAPLPMPSFGNLPTELERVRRLKESCGLKALLLPGSLCAAYLPTGLECSPWQLPPPPDAAYSGWQAPDRADRADDPEAISFIQFTSGSLSAPRGVMNSRGAVQACITAMVDALQLSSADVIASWLPLHHDMGLVGFLLTPMSTGIDLHLMTPSAFIRRPRAFLRMMDEVGGSVAFMPAFAYGLLARALSSGASAERLDLGKWRVAGVGGDQIDLETLAKFADGARPSGFTPASFRASYGLAEAVLAVTLDRSAMNAVPLTMEDGRKLADCGSPIEGIEIEIRAADGTALPEAVEGRVWIRGRAVTRRFADGSQQDSDWLDTGDSGLLSAGRLYISGRTKAAIKTNGRTIWPQDIEALLQAAFGFRHGTVAVFSSDAFNSGSVVVALKLAVADTALTRAVHALVAERYQLDCSVIGVEPGFIPLTTSGKIARGQLRSNYLNWQVRHQCSTVASKAGN